MKKRCHLGHPYMLCSYSLPFPWKSEAGVLFLIKSMKDKVSCLDLKSQECIINMSHVERQVGVMNVNASIKNRTHSMIFVTEDKDFYSWQQNDLQ